ncbi:hypothetical protein KUH03_17810 [Sphingobacterium sp. E70]|uniref:hypothetical protein n=1 Tax=Sphingobacterium sp. E70 TaxID=2853439 RepID=UPI00211C6584|nr:hypothetical protein [Sphingobacterium sp. E70]ULT28277.1 hypothetical protein KUH03_17810 [Sphingobacterium sp. E70]
MIKFYLFVVFEYFLHLLHIKRVGRIEIQRRERNPILDNEIIFHTHEWAGYCFERHKEIKYTGNKFVCGLKFYFDKFNSYKGANSIKGILTVSDLTEQYESRLKQQGFYNDKVKIYAVPNCGMDFSGYSFVAKI